MADPVPTQPNACGLAVALPLELSDVEAALGGGPYCDYVGRSAALGSADKLWNGGLSRVAQAIAKLAESADGHGVRVVLRARRQDLADLFASCRVVTVLAHWRGPEIAPRDLRQPPLDFAQRLAGDSGECGVLLMQALRTDWLEFLSKAPDLRLQRSRLAEMLDQRLRQTPALAKPPNGTTWHMDTETLRHFNRTCLDRRWPDDLARTIHRGLRCDSMDGDEALGVA